jgi:predicted GH43/DUF377 family glycosyl hydrolase
MKWTKRGLIWAPKKDKWWNQKYGILPVPQFIKDKNIIRIFFGSADKNNDSRISYIDVSADKPSQVVFETKEPIIDIGPIGTFDDSGVVPSCAIKIDNRIHLYTVGFQRCEKVPYMLFPGLAISDENGNIFMKYTQSPIMPRNEFRPTSHGAPCVLKIEDKYKMWHWFSNKWIEVEDKLYLNYQIGYAESIDGINWVMQDITCISPDVSKGEFAVARPWVVYSNGLYQMWYSIRIEKKLYRIGYAESHDGINWQRKDDEAGIDVSNEGWDSEMICYPAVIKVKDKTYMFYNGNNNGATGFGYAELLEE